jgi:hypothetical protein
VHSARGFESVVADGRLLELEKAKELIVLDAFFSDAPDERESFLYGQASGGKRRDRRCIRKP